MAVDERGLDGLTGARKGDNLELDLLPTTDSRAGHDQIPVNPFDGEVLTGGADVDRMSFALQFSDQLQRINADRPFRSAVVDCIVVRVTNEPRTRHLGVSSRLFWNAAAREVD